MKFVALIFLAPVLASASSMSDEEVVVRITYAKLAFSTKVGFVNRFVGRNVSVSDLNEIMAREELKVELSDFTSGSVKDIADRPYSDLVTKPQGERELSVSTARHTFNGQQVPGIWTTAHWVNGRDLSHQDWSLPYGAVAKVIEHGDWYSRYAAYTVKVSFEGKSRTYHAMFLFGKDDKGQDFTMAADNVTNASCLTSLAKESVYPTILFLRRRFDPAVSDWLKSIQDESCKPGEVCCDPETLVCKISLEGVAVQ